MKKETVRPVQLLMGYTPADGEESKGFAAFVKAWQKKDGIDADGIVGKNTLKRLCRKLPVLKSGRRGDPVRALRLLMGQEEEGAYDAEAVKTYQKEKGLAADGICGVRTWTFLLTGARINERPKDFKQYAAPWGKTAYSACGDKKQTMASSGCGPTAMADIARDRYDKKATPRTLADKSLSWGTRTRDSGTAGRFFEKCARMYGCGKYETSADLGRLIECLDGGGLAAVCVGPSKWTKGGHYLCVWRFDGRDFYVNDPASASAARARGSYAEMKKARKRCYLFGEERK